MTEERATDGRSASRYVGVAGGCALLHNVIVIGATSVGSGVLAASALSFGVMIVVGYLSVCAIAFRLAPTLPGFARYTMAMATNFPLTTGLLWLFAGPFDLPVAIAAPPVTVLMFGINYLGARWAVGRRFAPCAF